MLLISHSFRWVFKQIVASTNESYHSDPIQKVVVLKYLTKGTKAGSFCRALYNAI